MPGYGVDEDLAGVLPWSWAVDLLNSVRNPVVSTTRPDGRPHAMPVWGLWLDDVFAFSTGITTVKSVNLKGDPRCVITAGDREFVIVEGRAELADMPKGFVESYKEKYDYQMDETMNPIWVVRPTVAFAFQDADNFTKTATRWTF